MEDFIRDCRRNAQRGSDMVESLTFAKEVDSMNEVLCFMNRVLQSIANGDANGVSPKDSVRALFENIRKNDSELKYSPGTLAFSYFAPYFAVVMEGLVERSANADTPSSSSHHTSTPTAGRSAASTPNLHGILSNGTTSNGHHHHHSEKKAKRDSSTAHSANIPAAEPILEDNNFILYMQPKQEIVGDGASYVLEEDPDPSMSGLITQLFAGAAAAGGGDEYGMDEGDSQYGDYLDDSLADSTSNGAMPGGTVKKDKKPIKRKPSGDAPFALGRKDAKKTHRSHMDNVEAYCHKINCDYCDYTNNSINSASAVAKHIRLHHRVEWIATSTYKCEEIGCDYISPKASQLNIHKRVIHGTFFPEMGGRIATLSEPTPCSLCGEIITDVIGFVAHLKSHQDVIEGSVAGCNDCGWKFNFISDVYSHWKSHPRCINYQMKMLHLYTKENIHESDNVQGI